MLLRILTALVRSLYEISPVLVYMCKTLPLNTILSDLYDSNNYSFFLATDITSLLSIMKLTANVWQTFVVNFARKVQEEC